MVNTPVDINQVKQSAATGHFRSIALWLNHLLVPQSIYAQVQTDQYPGYLRILVEFERPPKKDALIRLVCSRLCRLESNVIRGIYLVGRLVGTSQPLWQQRVRLAQRKQPAQKPADRGQVSSASTTTPGGENLTPGDSNQSTPQTATPQPNQPQTDTITAATYRSDALKAVPSYLIPRENNAPERRRRQKRTVVPFPTVQIRSANIDKNQTSKQRRLNRRRLAPKETIEQQFKYMRAIVVTGSAAAAFILGCVTEAVLSQRGQMARKEVSPSLPTFTNNGGWRTLSDVEIQEIDYRAARRGSAVPAALESVAVMPHQPSSDPQDPTVTLMFGGEVPVGDVPLQTPDAVEQVLGNLEVFQSADVAMVGLGNSLATADTSLQENYFDRSRPDAADALLRGGIDIVGLTGDQTMAFGRQGLIETLEALDSAGIYRVGAGRNPQEARRPEVLEVKGQRIAYLSYAPDSDDVATLGQAGLNIQAQDDIIEDIAALREAVDWIVVNYRWYGDLEAEPSAQQVKLSHSAIDAGADLVVGYHPRQLQGAELYKSCPIVYSLGDFIFEDAPLDDHDTAALRVSLRDKQMKVEFLPVSVREARPKAATGEAAKAILKDIRQASESLSSPLHFPAILDAASPRGPLLKPEKPAAPLRTLGELEPAPLEAPLDAPTYEAPAIPDANFVPNPAGFDSGAFENFIPESESLNLVPFEEFAPESGGPESTPLEAAPSEFEEFDQQSTFDPRGFEAESWNDHAPAMPTDSQRPDQCGGALDSFSTQPDQANVEGSNPLEGWQTFDPEKQMSAPKLDGARLDSDAGLEAWPEPDDILVPTEQPLEGYDTLENWGQKSSPHKEFNPIQERLNSLDALPLDPSSDLLPIVPDPARETTDESSSENDAISPHDEPLVGPLG